ncbi:hypothetical protein Hanom_Chr09g00870841 [Helianthus anomalus]
MLALMSTRNTTSFLQGCARTIECSRTLQDQGSLFAQDTFGSKPTFPALCAGAPACFCRSSFISCHYFFFFNT